MEKGLEIEKLRGQLQELQGRTVAEFTSHLSGLMERHVSGLQATAAPPLANGHVAGSRRDHGKRFVPRESLLTELFHISHIRTIYHIFVAMLVLLFTHAILIDMVEHGTLSLSPSLLVYAFGGVRVTAETWLLMFCSVIFLVYPTFHFWATHRSSSPVLFDWLFSSTFVAYCGCLLYLPAVVVMQHRLPPASSFIVLLEQIRLFMKVYAFVRSIVVRARAPETKDLDRCPNFSTFLLFMFVPTLVYRDSYPRTDRVRWGRVVLHPGAGGRLRGLQSSCWSASSMPPFHSGTVWDWWNVTNYASFYRTWNIVVHDWLYEYIYSDVVRYRGKLMATLAVFVVSSIVHEYTLMFVFNFFFPILFLQFGVFGVLLHFMNVRSAAGNVLLWITLSLGVGIDMTFYTAEWYARHNCPQIYDNVYADFFSSRALSCWSRNITEGVLGESTVPAPA
ncbi:sterol O-acyltransferase 1-like [Pollicipes pollicipes]|uniref:sterol O-acyltransferase 1-like n=1 Tax=Pollicipes pollicipes TaxID=41117 RepID=UPI0018851ED9|nr:sterol O-acyltransferase 1-like [Pollicipes pollicipes]